MSNMLLRTNVSPLKRSFDTALNSTEPTSRTDCTRERRQYVDEALRAQYLTDHTPRRYTKRRISFDSSTSIMLAQSTTIMSGSFPSFMSVYGNEDNNLYGHALVEHHVKSDSLSLSQFGSNSHRIALESPPHLTERRGSLTSTASYSTGSSPTTTSSTFDSPLMAEKSPDSSPESASSAVLPKMFQQPRTRSTGTQTLNFPEEQADMLLLRPSRALHNVEEQRRNPKQLTLDMKFHSSPQSATGSDDSLPFSAPTSPLREPLRTGRRKPTNLSIRTPGFHQSSFGINSLAIAPTPGLKPALHQAQSSPSLPALASPTTGPVGGMRLAMPNIAQTLKETSSSHNSMTMPSTNLPSLREEPYQPPKSQEAPERGYTDGPRLIYDTGVYLYLEPTAEEASKFDTVINVAKEIKNPFENSTEGNNTVVSVWRNAGNSQSINEPQTAMSEKSFKSAFEWPTSSRPVTPTTPRPSSISQLKKPEYLHVKWDHNSEILDDLLPLCRLIDSRVQDGKKVLIHCQLGVSRSASLIIAYGLYKSYESDFHSMYMAVKKRSQWVGPNMSLIYQLTDFKSKCDNGVYKNSTQQPKPEWFVYGCDNARTPTAPPQPTKITEPARQIDREVESLLKLKLNKELPPVPSFSQDRMRTSSTKPLHLPTRLQTTRNVPSSVNNQIKPIKQATPRALPFREMGYSSLPMEIPPHRPRASPGLTFIQPSMDLAKQDVPAAPSLFSPRAAEFVAAPFGVTTAGDLATTTPKAMQPPPGAFPGGTEWRNSLLITQDTQEAPAVSVVAAPKPFTYDPRSPHFQDETRAIFDQIDSIL